MMNEDIYYFKISPEVILGDLIDKPYSGTPIVYTTITGNPYACCVITGTSTTITIPKGKTGYYLPMSQVVTGGTNGNSILTGLTIPIVIRENSTDLGYYSVFDGALLQKDVVKNFVFSAKTTSPYVYYFYNTSEQSLKSFLELSSYTVDWGDNSVIQTITSTAPNYITHDYTPVGPGTYTITLSQKNPWGINTVKKTVTVPYTNITINNPNGTAYFTPNIGSWSATPISYDYIYDYDSNNHISAQTSNNFVSTPFIISGHTKSRINELRQYGSSPFQLLKWVVKDNQNWGVITSINTNYTGYTIEGVNYFDFSGDTTVYVLNSSGLTSNWMVQEPIVKDEALLNIVSDVEVQSDIFIERGKNSAIENVERLGEIDNIGDLVDYGYGFYNIVYQN